MHFFNPLPGHTTLIENASDAQKTSRYAHSIYVLHCVKYRKFTKFHGVKVLWKDTVSA